MECFSAMVFASLEWGQGVSDNPLRESGDGVDDENPKYYFARVTELANTLLSVREYRKSEQIARAAIRQLSHHYDIEKRSTLARPGLRLDFVRHVVQKSYAERVLRELKERGQKDSGMAAAVPVNPHALATFAGPGAQSGGGRCGGRGYGGYHGARGPQPGDGAYLSQQRLWQGGSGPMPQQGAPPLGRGRRSWFRRAWRRSFTAWPWK